MLAHWGKRPLRSWQSHNRSRCRRATQFAQNHAGYVAREGEPPQGKWEDLKYLEPVRDYPARHASTLLIFDAVVEAVEQIESAS